nr:hypothetical protein 6 [Piscirickettsiaceae bacterium]
MTETTHTHYNSPCDIPKGQKHDQGKTLFNLIPPLAHEAYAEVLTFGAQKYTPDNWRKVPDAKIRYMNAAFRHLHAHRKGEFLDPESNQPHLAHAIASLSFVLELELEEAIKDHGKMLDQRIVIDGSHIGPLVDEAFKKELTKLIDKFNQAYE